MYVRREGALVRVHAPAKLNLFLEVLARRDDGFHEIETLLVPVRAFDTLVASASQDQGIELACRWRLSHRVGRAAGRGSHGERDGWKEGRDPQEIPSGAENLVYRALHALRKAAGVEQGARVELTKRIPAAAGLGGGSSDAAAALLAGNEVWDLHWSTERLAELAADLGSDVPFFLGSGAAVGRGRGEQLEQLDGIPGLHVVIAKPPVGLSTPEVYRQCQPTKQPRSVAPLVAALRAGRWNAIQKNLFNRLQGAAESLTPWIGWLRAAFDRAGCELHQMSGSGSSYFGICRHASQARRVAGRLQAAGLECVCQTATMPLTFRPV